MEQHENLLIKLLAQAEEIFGPRTEYSYGHITWGNADPQVVIAKGSIEKGEPIFLIRLNGRAINDPKDLIFQLSHEAVHLLSPMVIGDDNEINVLEEGVASYFSIIATENETGDADYARNLIGQKENYSSALQAFEELLLIDPQALLKLRCIQPYISLVSEETFLEAKLFLPKKLIENLVSKFNYH